MNEKYAVEPVVFRSYIEFQYVMEKFGIDQGRFLAEYPKRWRRMLFENIASLPDVEQLRFKRILEWAERNGATLRTGLPYEDGKSWVDNALDKKEKGAFAEVIAEGGKGGHTLHDIDEELLADGRGARIMSTADNLLAVAAPLLQCSMEVFLVDPYISLGKSTYLKFFRALLASQYARDTAFVFFSSDAQFSTKEPSERIARRELLPYMQSGSSARFVSLGNCSQMHARYMFSIKGALKFDKGFQADGQTLVDVEAVSRTIRDDYFIMYHEKEHELEIVNQFTIEK